MYLSIQLNLARYSVADRWRNFGIMFAYIIFNVFGALFLYWLTRVPKKSKKADKPTKADAAPKATTAPATSSANPTSISTDEAAVPAEETSKEEK